jgi:hypothetical protein
MGVPCSRLKLGIQIFRCTWLLFPKNKAHSRILDSCRPYVKKERCKIFSDIKNDLDFL